MGIRCREFVELVTGYLDAVLTADAERQFLAHRTSCPGCRRYLDQMRAAVELLRALDPAAPHGHS